MNAHFVRGQDPKISIGVGLISRLKPGTILKCKKRIKPHIKSHLNFFIEVDWYSIVKTVKVSKKKIDLELATYDKYPKSFKLVDLQFCGGEYLTLTHEEFFDHFEIIKTIEESINFERGIDPMDSMKLGKFHERQLERAKEELKELFDHIKNEYGGKTRVYKAISSLGTGVRATWIPPSAPYNYGIEFFKDKDDDQYYFTPIKWNKPGKPFASQFYGGRKSSKEAANEMIAQWGGQELVNQWGKTNEAINFERGIEPKRAMKIGKNQNNLFTEIPSINFLEYLIDWLHPDFPQANDADMMILKAAAKMLQVPKEKVLVASDDKGTLYSSQIEEIMENHEWTYEGEMEVGGYMLIGSSTKEIYVKVEKTEEVLYILGTIY